MANLSCQYKAQLADLRTYLRVRHRARFAQTVCLIDLNLKSFVHSIHKLPCQRCSTACNHLDGREVVFVDHLVSSETHDYGGRNVDERDS
jgi:hypothetical protein